MRYAPLGVVVLLLATVPALAQTSKDIRVVKTQTAEVWPFPSTKSMYYVTNRLKFDDPVEVVEERADGWLKIRPPAGSTSWINTRFLKTITQNQPTMVVATPDAAIPVYPSPADATTKRPTIEGVRLKGGHQVYALSKIHRDEQGDWQEIESPENETRYIRAEAVRKAGPDVVRTMATSVGLQRSTAPSARSVPPAEELRRKAVLADQSGNMGEAVRLYDQISRQYASTYPELARMCRARADYLRGEMTERVAPQAATSTVSRDNTNSTFARTESGATPGVYRGWLSVARQRGDRSERLYFLTLSPPVDGVSYVYVQGSTGIDLEGLAGRAVEVRGTMLGYSTELRANRLRATQATPAD